MSGLRIAGRVVFVLAWSSFAFVTSQSDSSNGALGQWIEGRSTFYGSDAWSIHEGSCGYGTIYQDDPLGWNVAAMPDGDPMYVDSCGRCLEVQCRPAEINDNYGGSFDRSKACYDSSTSIVVRITDTCPCVYPANAYSNKRWCCSDAPHLDVSVWAWERLADKKYGVIAIRYRAVPCDYQVDNLAPVAPQPTPAGRIPYSKRTARDWPEFWPQSVQPTIIYAGSISEGFTQQFHDVDSESLSIPAIDGDGNPLCGNIQSKGAMSFAVPKGVFQNRISLSIWLYVGGDQDSSSILARRSLMMVIGGAKGDCRAVSLVDVKPTGMKPTCTDCTTYWWRFEVFLSAFAGFGPTSVINNAAFFKGCGNNDVTDLTYFEIRNYQSNSQSTCVDHIQLS